MEDFKKQTAASPGGGEAAEKQKTRTANISGPAAKAQAVPIPTDPRVLRVVLALYDLMIPDRTGAESIKSYSIIDEVMTALWFIRHADAVTIQRACLRAMAANGDLPPRAEVLEFPVGGGK